MARPLGDFRGWVRLMGQEFQEVFRGKRSDVEKYLKTIDDTGPHGEPVTKALLPASEQPIIPRRAA